MSKKPSGAEGRLRRVAALAQGRQPKRGRPKGSRSPQKRVAALKAQVREDVAFLMQAKPNNEFNIFISEPRRVAKWHARELKNKGGRIRDKYGRWMRDEHGDFVRDPKKYSDVTYETLERYCEDNERGAYGARGYTHKTK